MCGRNVQVRRSRSNPNSRQLVALKQVFAWRDQTARQEDESPEFVMPSHALLKVCTELPREMQGILACCSPVPPLVRQNLQALHLIILRSREAPLETTPAAAADIEVPRGLRAGAAVGCKSVDLADDPLGGTLDLSRLESLTTRDRDLLDVVANSEALSQLTIKSKPDLVVFERRQGPPTTSKSLQQAFLSPYLRYRMLKPYLRHMQQDGVNAAEGSDKDEHADRVRSIREHFDALTAMTPEEFQGSETKEKEEDEEEAGREAVAEDEEEVDPGRVKPLRAGMALDRKRRFGKKRKGGGAGHQDQPKSAKAESAAVDYEAADFGQFSKDKGKKKGGAYDPWDGFHKRGGGGGKKKFKSGMGGRSVSYRS